MADLIQGFLKNPDRQHAVQDGERRRPGRADDAQRGRDQRDAAAHRRSRLHGQHDRPLRADAAAEPRDRSSCCAERPELIPGAIEEVLRCESAVQFFPSRSVDRRHRGRRDGHPRGLGGPPAVRRGEPRPEEVPRTRTSSTPSARTTSTWAGAAASTPASAVRSRAWRSTSRSRRSYAVWRTRGSSSTRRRTGVNNVFRGPLHLLVEFDGITD